MKTFDPNYKLLDEMYQDNYYPTRLPNRLSFKKSTISAKDSLAGSVPGKSSAAISGPTSSQIGRAHV